MTPASATVEHYDGCWREHLQCAILKVAALERENQRLRETDWYQAYMAELARLQQIKLWMIALAGNARKIDEALREIEKPARRLSEENGQEKST